MASESADIYLRFEGQWAGDPIKGDCSDAQHPGEFAPGEAHGDRKDGWIQIQSFSFAFGAGDPPAASEVRRLPDRNRDPAAYAAALEAQNRALIEERNREKRQPKQWGKSGPLDFDKFSFSKAVDRLSPVLVEISHAGNYKIPLVEVEAVRYGGTGEDFKIPFVRYMFKNVYIKSCKLNLVNEENPTEDVDFEYDIVIMETLWTDNATGERLPQRPITAGWNLPEQKQAK